MTVEVPMPTPYSGQEFTFTNPDGSQVRVRGFGNQFAAVFETLDGFTVVRNPDTGFYHYATLSHDGSRLEPTGPVVGSADPAGLTLPRHARPTADAIRAVSRSTLSATQATPRWKQRRAGRKPRKPAEPVDDTDRPEAGASAMSALAAPSGVVGPYVGLCLLIRFPDVPGDISQAEVTEYCNTDGYTGFGNKGSVHEYFRDVSGGRLDYTNIVTKYVTAKHSRAWYTSPKVEFGVRAQDLIHEGLGAIKADGFDFDQLTDDSGGYVRALNVFYAGPTVNAWREGLWPHSWTLEKPFTGSTNRTFSDYQITNIGSELTLRTFCHENGHMICDFPDLYDYGGESGGVGDFCLMGSGGSDTNPVHVCGYLKRQAGWARASAIRPGTAVKLTAGTNEVLVHSRSRTEYFVIENRQRKGRDAALPDSGLAIWHVDETGSNDFEAMTRAEHYECSLEQADARFDLERRGGSGDSGDLFAGPTRRAFGALTKPNSRWWNGVASGLEIVDISASGATMTVTTVRARKVSLANLKYGVRNSAHVKELQKALNAHFSGLRLPVNGSYLSLTDSAVRRCQRVHGFGADRAKKSSVGQRQATHLGLLT
jgi:M6 family metalloprotease-like protein